MTMNGDFNREVHFEIVEPIGVLAAHSTGWRKELNLVKWNGGQPKYDIRDWSPDHAHMSRGVTLHEKEMRLIFDLLRKRRNSSRNRQYDADSAAGNVAEAAAPPFTEETEAAPTPAPPPAPPEPPEGFHDDFGSMEISDDGEVL